MQNEEFLLNKLAMLLAGSGMTSQQLYLVIRIIRTTDPSILVRRVEEYRNIEFSDEIESPATYESAFIKEKTSSFIDEDALYSIERLIVKEAGLPKNVAVVAISSALKKLHPSLILPKFNPKEGFSKWLTQVSKIVTLSEILHVAATIRNGRMHYSADEWIKELNSNDRAD